MYEIGFSTLCPTPMRCMRAGRCLGGFSDYDDVAIKGDAEDDKQVQSIALDTVASELLARETAAD